MAATAVTAQAVVLVECCLLSPAAAAAAAEIRAAQAGVSAACFHLSPDPVASKAVPAADSPTSCRPFRAAAAVMVQAAVESLAPEASTTTAAASAHPAMELHRKPRARQRRRTAGTSSPDINSQATSSQVMAHHRQRASSRAITMRSPLLTSKDTRPHNILSRDTVSLRSSSHLHLKEGMVRAAMDSRDTMEDTGTSMARAVRVVDTR